MKSEFCMTICKENELEPEGKNKLNSVKLNSCSLFDEIIKEFNFSSCSWVIKQYIQTNTLFNWISKRSNSNKMPHKSRKRDFSLHKARSYIIQKMQKKNYVNFVKKFYRTHHILQILFPQIITYFDRYNTF